MELRGLIGWAFSGIAVPLLNPCRRWIRRAKRRLLQKEFVPTPISFRVRRAGKPDFAKIAELAAFYLGEGHGVSDNTAKAWSERNADVFTIAECRTDGAGDWQFCGYASLLPLSEAASSLLCSGKIQDYDLTPESILQASQPPKEVFIMDIMTNIERCPKKNCCRQAGGLLLSRVRKDLKDIKTKHPHFTRVFTLIASRNGERLAQHFGFSIDSDYQSPFGWKLYEKRIETVEQLNSPDEG